MYPVIKPASAGGILQEDQAKPARQHAGRQSALLLFSVFVVSMCGIFYELLLGSVASYIIGNSITQFSITIGLFMFFMGVGSYLSKYIEQRLLDRFILIEIAIGAAGGMSVLLLLGSFSLTRTFYPIALLLIASISTMIGLEIPLVTRLVRQQSPGGDLSLKNSLANVLALDYVGALIASLLFPLLLLPSLGLMLTGFVIGVINLSVAFLAIHSLRRRLQSPLLLFSTASAVLTLLLLGIYFSSAATRAFESFLYEDEIIYAAQSPYQRIVLTKFRSDLRLYLNGDLQFSSRDEYRYHESLIHIPLGLIPQKKQILLLGGGDGLAARELLKFPEIEKITLVDLDRQMVDLAAKHPLVKKLNQGALDDPRVDKVYTDAFNFIETGDSVYDAIIVDLPDPNDLSLGKLYSAEFYKLAAHRLSRDGIFVTQATSPYFARRPFWMIKHTMAAAFPHTDAYTVAVPSFGQWGFILGAGHKIDPSRLQLSAPTRFITAENAQTQFNFDPDMAEIPTDINRLDNQLLVPLYEQSWKDWN